MLILLNLQTMHLYQPVLAYPKVGCVLLQKKAQSTNFVLVCFYKDVTKNSNRDVLEKHFS